MYCGTRKRPPRAFKYTADFLAHDTFNQALRHISIARLGFAPRALKDNHRKRNCYRPTTTRTGAHLCAGAGRVVGPRRACAVARCDLFRNTVIKVDYYDFAHRPTPGQLPDDEPSNVTAIRKYTNKVLIQSPCVASFRKTNCKISQPARDML
ncbi:hypothetical protein EVAR_50736_1 [Eumeta japonica]|uniref:Uncharacterized protein n=1 Tax=Eumeta variegata TaxID=151549 RepID=A0A4C1Y5Y4_EUMVA|nr:hypothetical protein EVAR_50736_1 [Eumeta japonica]